MSLWLIAGTAILFILITLLVTSAEERREKAARLARDADLKRRVADISRDEKISMRQDEDMEFFNETDTEGQEDDPQGEQ